MSDTSKKKKYLMWYKINELFSKGFKVVQISLMEGLHRHTVSKYVRMSEDEFLSSESYERHYSHKLDAYEQFVVERLRRWPFLSAPQIHDHLKENFADLPEVTPKTVFNFVERIRRTHELPRSGEGNIRPYEKQPETPYGEWAQADFGERWMERGEGSKVKVYFFAISLSRSRYKYVFISLRPFTTALAVYAHELAFKYFGGVPRKIRYDQDKVLLADENLGDLALTSGFRALVRENNFTPVFCRKSDPESKGQIENVVKYVKYNFLRGREFTGIDTLNEQCLAWLERTANGTEHHGIRRIPALEFDLEKEHLLPYNGTPAEPKTTLTLYHVRKDSVIGYHSNYYTVPTGTYRGRNTMVHVEEKDGRLLIYSQETGKLIATHAISKDKGVLVRNTDHLRDKEGSLDEYQQAVRSQLPADSIVDEYLATLRKRKNRNFRDNLQFIQKRAASYSAQTLAEAMRLCRDSDIFNGCSLMAVAESLRQRKGEPIPDGAKAPTVAVSLDGIDLGALSPEKTSVESFSFLFQ